IAYIHGKQRAKDKLQQSLESYLPAINKRQHQVLLYFLHHPNSHTTVTAHCNTYNVVRQTARTDLSKLEKLGFLCTEIISREFVYKPVPNLESIIREVSSR
ncbi:MAG: hypothetical protein IKT79_01250, partial [Akkermansia sp.]|nr:hypothetical protein [Akkermansia sp.]